MPLAEGNVTMHKPASIFAAASFAAASLLSSVALAQDAEPTPAPPPAPMLAPVPVAPVAPTPTMISQPAPRPFPDRHGFTIGFAFGPGYLGWDGEEVEGDVTSGVSLRLGAAVTPNVLVQGTLEAVRTSEGDVAAQLSFMGVSATGYLNPRVYLIGGLGIARMTLELPDPDFPSTTDTYGSDREAGLLLGAGVELYQSVSFGLSLEARTILASFDGDSANGTSIQLGFQWW
jgi:hypothetical protein